MLKAVYYYKGFKILADVDGEGEKSGPFYVFRLQKGHFTRMHNRRGNMAVSGVQLGIFEKYANAVEYIKDTERKSKEKLAFRRRQGKGL